MADVSQLLVLIKGLPMAYNRDLQEDKLALFDAFDTVEACLEVAPALITGADLQVDRINEKIDDGFLDATALMEYLIKRGVPMRTGHGTVGKLVAECEDRKCQLKDLSIEDLKAACDLIDESVYDILGTHNAVAALQSFGSGGKAPVEEQLAYWQNRLLQ
jgi:argininosuccinate lyase